MNIQEAKEEIIHTLQVYHRKDTEGRYTFPLVRQRPILLMGPPGIGKTAIMEQIAQECGVGLVAYTITHHTRQSAVGLPKIVAREYGGREVSVTEYTMSEIIASVYECMERTGKTEGILFIDEINCVSETLAPTMLQFLQNKTFGSHKVPEGWMIVAAGNPPEYNKSVREFDIVTLDRVRKIEIDAELDTWMGYAWERGLHGAILSYLSLKKDHFYIVEKHADEKMFVTARGWEDLSEVLRGYEELDIPVSESLMLQFLQKKEIARSFAAYYLLYRKYGMDYGIREILDGSLGEVSYAEKVKMAGRAAFDERFTVTGLVLDALAEQFEVYDRVDAQAVRVHELLQQFRKFLEQQADMTCLSEFNAELRRKLETKTAMELISAEEEQREECVIRQLEAYDTRLRERHITEREDGFRQIRALFQEKLQERTELIRQIHGALSRAFAFTADCFGTEQEMILLITGLNRSRKAMDFIRVHGCSDYLKYGRVLLGDSEAELLKECREAL